MKNEINEFSPEVIDELKSYVYRLIDPRNGNTFYVGKGKGNRVFTHMNGALTFEGIEDEASEKDDVSEKIGIIRDIHKCGLKVIHVIHRHGLSNDTALEVEAALIDAYPGLSNIVSGIDSERGSMNAQQIQDIYKAEVIEAISEKCIIIKIKQWSIDRAINDYNCNMSDAIYEATRAAWKLSMDRAKNADYVLAVLDGIVRAVYYDLQWGICEKWAPRLAFQGREASKNMLDKYVGKRIPLEYRKRGLASPCLYVNC
jgi:hypothetical protein